MATASSSKEDADDAVWLQHAATIRTRYLDKSKSSKETSLSAVKSYMEETHGFPVFPKHVWESKLKNVLGIRKKLKKHDWPRVYKHYAQRRAQGKDSRLYLNEEEIEWKRAWKEMRRNGALKQPVPEGRLSPLAPGIELRTPSPVRRPVLPSPSNRDHSPVVPSSSNQWPDVTLLVSELSGLFPQEIPDAFSLAFQGIPMLKLIDQIGIAKTSMIPHFPVQTGQMRLFVPAEGQSTASIFQFAVPLALSHGNNQVAQDVFPRFQLAEGHGFDTSYLLSVNKKGIASHLALQDLLRLLFKFSNGLTRYTDSPDELCLLAKEYMDVFHMSGESLQSFPIFHNHVSPRAAWDHVFSLVHASVQRKHDWRTWTPSGIRDVYTTLVEIGKHYRWLSPNGPNNYLSDHIGMVPPQSRPDLPRAHHGLPNQGQWLDPENLDVPSKEISLTPRSIPPVQNTIFQDTEALIDAITDLEPPLDLLHLLQRLDVTNEQHMAVLSAMLEKGPDVDYTSPQIHQECFASSKWFDNGLMSDAWPMSVLDACFYLSDSSIFLRLAPFSRAINSTITRAGFLTVLRDQPTESLSEYLSARAPLSPVEMESWLSTLLYETIHNHLMEDIGRRPAKTTTTGRADDNFNVIYALIELGADVNLKCLLVNGHNSRPSKAPLDLAILAYLRTQSPDWLQTLEKLLDHGAIVTSKNIDTASQHCDKYLLNCLAARANNLHSQGINALMSAVSLNDAKAIDSLLSTGVGINGYVDLHGVRDLTVVGQCLHSCHARVLDSVEFFTGRGAHLRYTAQDVGGFWLLRAALRLETSLSPQFESLCQYIMDHIDQTSFTDSNQPTEFLLDACAVPDFSASAAFEPVRLRVFRSLFAKRPKMKPGSPITVSIALGGGPDLAEELWKAGADINAYAAYDYMGRVLTPLQIACFLADDDMVSWLLKRGADPTIPASGFAGLTALQAVCAFDAISPEEHTRKANIVKRLLGHTASPSNLVNAAPAPGFGYTALQTAAMRGDLDVALLLLVHGADVNAPPCEMSDRSAASALDLAADFGRLDMVQLLLNVNALSSERGETGYQGAIQNAESGGYFAIANLMRQHYANNSELGIPNPYLAIPPRDHSEYMYTESDYGPVYFDLEPWVILYGDDDDDEEEEE